MTRVLEGTTKEAYLAYMKNTNTPLEYRFKNGSCDWISASSFVDNPELEFRIAKLDNTQHANGRFMQMRIDDPDCEIEMSHTGEDKMWVVHTGYDFSESLFYRVKPKVPKVNGKFFKLPANCSGHSYVVFATGDATFYFPGESDSIAFPGIVVSSTMPCVPIGSSSDEYAYHMFVEIANPF